MVFFFSQITFLIFIALLFPVTDLDLWTTLLSSLDKDKNYGLFKGFLPDTKK